MDEPFGAVDPVVRGRLQIEFRGLQRRLGKTVVFVTHDIDEAVMMATRVAILDIGGILEQYDTPEQILAEPATPFVARFLGEERGLRRLALRPVSKAELSRGPMVDVDSSPEEALRVMSDHGVQWVGLLDGERLLGWVGAEMIGTGALRDLTPRPFLVTLAATDSLRRALDAVVTGRARVAVVVEGDQYMGMLDLEQIAEEITE
jgi:osmoprotectant transport system ATP-binding protein